MRRGGGGGGGGGGGAVVKVTVVSQRRPSSQSRPTNSRRQHRRHHISRRDYGLYQPHRRPQLPFRMILEMDPPILLGHGQVNIRRVPSFHQRCHSIPAIYPRLYHTDNIIIRP